MIEAVTYAEWSRFVRRLESLGFRHRADTDEPLCRYADGDLVVDVMPTGEEALGVGSRWYAEAVQHRILATDLEVHVISPLYLVATKLDAWPAEERSGGDAMASHDVEDIVAVLRGVPGLLDEIRTGSDWVHREVRNGLAALFGGVQGPEVLAAHLEPDEATQAIAPMLLAEIRRSALS